MGFLDVILGRTKPTKSRREVLFSISTAEITLRSRYFANHTGQAGVSFKPVESSFFANLDSEIRDLLRISAKSTGTDFSIREDDFGYRWIILNDKDFEDLVSLIHMVGETIADHGYGPSLLAAVFGFREGGKEFYWIYNYKRGKFYPFAPLPGNMQRDNATELRLRSWMEKELPIEKQLEQWYGLWGIPF